MTERKPELVQYDLGHDRYQRRTRLVGERESNGTVVWSIVSEPVNQRDEGEHIRSLTTAQLLDVGAIASGHR